MLTESRHDVGITEFLAAAALATSADQASKTLTGRLLTDGRIHPGGWPFGFKRELNPRASLIGMPLGWAVVAWIAALAATAAVVAQGSTALGVGVAVGLGLALGGATSNLADRLLRGAVVDFISVGAWPTFNLADAAMVSGTVLVAGGLV